MSTFYPRTRQGCTPWSAPPVGSGFPLQRKCAQCDEQEKVQPKLNMSQPGDRFEQEADHVAKAVATGGAVPAISPMPASQIARQSDGASGVHYDQDGMSTSAVAPGASGPAAQSLVPRSGARGLPDGTRRDMEGRLGFDFSRVRIYTDGEAALAAGSLRARAFTTGRDVVFGANEFAPGTSSGRELLAHELTHVIQQRSLEKTSSEAHTRPAAVMRKPWDGAARLPLLPQLGSVGCDAIAGDRLDRQPLPLQKVVRASFPNPDEWFLHLGADRATLTAIYNRMCRFGLWHHIRSIGAIEYRRHRIVSPAEPPLWKHFHPAGAVAKIFFTTWNAGALKAGILGSQQLCLDGGLGGSLHRGQDSFREVSNTDSMHIAVGPGEALDIHIDQYSSPSGGGGNVCKYDPVNTSKHIGREVLPNLLRWKLKIPGIQAFPDMASPGPSNRGYPEGPPALGITIGGPGLQDVMERAIRDMMGPANQFADERDTIPPLRR
jgi:hypothetical protein